MTEVEGTTPRRAGEGLLAAAGGEPELANELARMFLEDLPKMVAELRAAAGAADTAGMRAAAHSLKGMAATLGFTEVAEVALSLESRARDGETEPDAVANEIRHLVAACDDASRAARAFLGEQTDEDSRR